MIDDSWIRVINKGGVSEYTFCGALEYRYLHIAKNWNTDTRKKYEREYNSIILPALKNHNDKSIREYTKEDYEEAIGLIKEKGYEKDGVRRRYSDSTIHHFENLIYYVVFQSGVYGLCEDVLWGTKFVLGFPNEESEIEERVVLKKSLTIEQEKRFAKEVLYDSTEYGAIVALLLMWALGLRNAEACGLNYGDIKPLEGHRECFVIWIYKSTKIKSAELQSGGKTHNAGRIIPIPDKVMAFLDERKRMLQKMLESQGRTDVNIDALPICCNGYIDFDTEDYLERCMTDHVTNAARDVFERAGITSKQLAYLDAELSEGNTAKILKEKDPTAYLLRRNFATQMCILGLSTSEMQYLIGHDVEDAYESRNEYVDSDRIYSMYLKLRQRELLNETNGSNKTEICIRGIGPSKVHISANEPTDSIHVRISDSSKTASTRWYEETQTPSPGREINILGIYQDRYLCSC